MRERVFFSSSRDALAFALNHEDLSIPGPVMNREMAEGLPGQQKHNPGAQTMGPPTRRAGQTSVNLGGTTDRTVLAGWILQRFDLVPLMPRTVLAAILINPRRPCACGAGCCRGWKIRADWVAQVNALSAYLKDEAEFVRLPGKRGYSLDPRMRVALVEDYCRPEEHRWPLAKLADTAGVSTTTAAKHRTLVFDHLGHLELQGWEEVNQLFDTAGITGALP